MRSGVLSDASIKRNCPAFFGSSFEAHSRHLSSFVDHVAPTHGLDGIHHEPRRVAKPRTPLLLLADVAAATSRDGGEHSRTGELVRAYHKEVEAEMKLETPPVYSTSSYSPFHESAAVAHTPHVTNQYASLMARRFDRQHSAFATDYGIGKKAKAFVEAFGGPVEDLLGVAISRFGTRVRNTDLAAVTQAAIVQANKQSNHAAAYQRIEEALRAIGEGGGHDPTVRSPATLFSDDAEENV